MLNDFGDLGRAYVETDEAAADEATIVDNILSSQYSHPLRVVAFNTAEGWARNVTEGHCRCCDEPCAQRTALSRKGRAGVFGTGARGNGATALPFSKTRRLSRARYKGRSSSKAVERDYPHMVEIVVPPSGLGQQLDQMYNWHRERNIEVHRGSGRREESRDIIRWCFADVKTAADFAAAFGGNVMT